MTQTASWLVTEQAEGYEEPNTSCAPLSESNPQPVLTLGAELANNRV